MKYTKIIILILLTLILPVTLWAVDFGIVTNIYTEYLGTGSEDDTVEFKADIIPRLSFLIGETSDLYFSIGLIIEKTGDEVLFLPELKRTELNIGFENFGIRVGNINYSDPLSLIVNGFFPGLQFYANTAIGRFGAGAWYTGLNYKKNAEITMTDEDKNIFYTPVDSIDNYFAPRRMFASFDWYHPSLGEVLQLNAAAILQFDLTDKDLKYNNQYFLLKAGIPVKSFLFELGGAIEASQTVTQNESVSNTAFAGDFGVFWMMPTNFMSRISFNGKIAGGNIEDETFSAFNPITSNNMGSIITHKMSGLSVFALNYSARLRNAFGLNINASYFIRNDLGTFQGYPLGETEENQGHFLGPEIFARILWAPVSDLHFNLGGGVFIPAMGDVAPDQKIHWRIDLTAILALL